MKKFIMMILVTSLLGGCSQELDDQTEELETDVEQAKEVLEDEMKGVVNSMKQELSKTAEQADEMFVAEGEAAEITRDVLVPVNETDYEELYGYIETMNYEDIELMREEGKLLFIEENTKVEVLERGYEQAKVRIESIEEVGFVPVRYLEQISYSFSTH